MDITQYVIGIFGIICFILCAFLIPYIKSKTSKEKLEKIEASFKAAYARLETIRYYADIFIRAAAQKYSDNATKKEYVTKLLTDQLEKLGIQIDTDELDAAIEGYYKEIKASLKD